MISINPDIVLILDNLIKDIKKVIITSSITPELDGSFTILSCNTYYLTPKSIVSINGVDYSVFSVVQNESIVVNKILESDPDPSGTEVLLGAPFFIHGTIITAKKELNKITEWEDKYPMIYLYEVYKERIVVDKTKSTGRESRVRLFFMDQTDPVNYTNNEQYVNVVRPVGSLVDSFFSVIENSKGKIGKLTDDPDLTPWVNFGKFETDKGVTKELFSDHISGYELSITLPIKRDYLEMLDCKSCN